MVPVCVCDFCSHSLFLFVFAVLLALRYFTRARHFSSPLQFFSLVCLLFTLLLFSVSLGLCCLINMTTSDKDDSCVQFNDNNYTSWEFQIKMYVKRNDLGSLRWTFQAFNA